MARWVIVGASRGIGLEMVRQLCARGEEVIAAVRKATPALEKTCAEVVEGVDVATEEGAARLARALGTRAVDALVHNAGVLKSDTLATLDFHEALRHYDVNALGPLRIVRALLANLREGAKVGIVTSRVGSLSDNTSGGNYAYRMSKAAANMAAKNLSIELAERGVAVAALHPGYVRTDMTQGRGNIEADVAARGLILRMDELDMDRTGAFWHAEGWEIPW